MFLHSHANYALTDEIWPKLWLCLFSKPTIWRIDLELNSCRDTIQVSYSIPAVKFILIFEQTILFHSRSPPAAIRSWSIHLQPDISFPEVSSVYSPSPNQDRPAVLSRIGFWFLLQKVNDVGINHVWEGGVQYNNGLIPRCNNKASFCKIAVFYVIVANPLPAYKLVP